MLNSRRLWDNICTMCGARSLRILVLSLLGFPSSPHMTGLGQPLPQAQQDIQHPKTAEEREACETALGWRNLNDCYIAAVVSARNRISFMRHSRIFATADLSNGTRLPRADENELTADLNQLLSAIWTIEMKFVRKTYPFKGHTRSYPQLKPRISYLPAVGAWACLDNNQRTIEISATLLQSVWRNALAEAVQSASDDAETQLNTESTFLGSVKSIQLLPLTFKDIQEENDSFERYANNSSLAHTAWPYLRLAEIDYAKAMYFIMAHEAAHNWLDRCKAPFTKANETSADDYGLLISISLLGEQFRPVEAEADLANMRETYHQQLLDERSAARKRLRTGGYKEYRPGSPESWLEPTKDDDQKLARQTDAAIREKAAAEFPQSDEPKMSQPLGYHGFETFVDVYKKADLREYVGDSEHPPMEVRLARLKRGYAAEALLGAKVLRRLYGTNHAYRIALRKAVQGAAESLTPDEQQCVIQMSQPHKECELRK